MEDLTHGRWGINVDGLSCLGARGVHGDVTISINNNDIFLYVYGNVRERCEFLFGQFQSKAELLLSPLNSETLEPISLKAGNCRLKVGRGSDVDIFIDDDSVSRLHAYVIVRDKCLFLADNFSSNKTYVNAGEVEKTTVRPGDIIEFGQTCYLLHYSG